MNFLKRIEELYRLHPEWIENFNRKNNTKFESLIAEISATLPASLKMQDLDLYNKRNDLSNLLMFMEPTKVLGEFGEDVLIWSWINYCFGDSRKEAFKEVIETRKEMPVLKMVRSVLWNKCSTVEFESIMKLYEMYVGLEKLVEAIDLPQLLRENAKEGITISEARAKDYSLEVLQNKASGGNLSSEGYVEKYFGAVRKRGSMEIYIDAPLALALKYKDEPQAVVSFILKDTQTLMIYQLQGVMLKSVDEKKTIIKKGFARGLIPIDWQASLVQLVEQIAVTKVVTELSIRSGYNNGWIKPDYKNDIRLPLEVALQRYDAVAERLGFTQQEDKNWYRIIKVE